MKRPRTRLERGWRARERKKENYSLAQKKNIQRQPHLCLSRPLDTDGVCAAKELSDDRKRKRVPAHNETPAALVQSSDLAVHCTPWEGLEIKEGEYFIKLSPEKRGKKKKWHLQRSKVYIRRLLACVTKSGYRTRLRRYILLLFCYANCV